jgi:hypothetical protein
MQNYRRSVVFIRGMYAALSALKLRFPDSPIEVRYAACKSFATLLLLGKFIPSILNITLLDIHQCSLDGAELLFEHFGFSAHTVNKVKGDACVYRHPDKLHLVIA